MTVTHGADLAQLRELGTTLKSQITAIDGIITAGAAVETTNWVGPAREAFLTQWQTSFKTALSNLQTAFDTAGTECAIRADNLEAAMGLAVAPTGAGGIGSQIAV